MTEHIFLLLVSIVINLYGSVALSQDNVLNRSHIVSKTAISGLQKRSYDSISPYDNIKWVNWGVGKTVNGGTVFRRSEGVLCATFLQDGNTAVIGEEHRTVVWNCQTGDVMKVLGLSKDETMSVCCLLGDSLFATATGNVISIWSARSLKLQETICERGSIYEMGFSNDGTHLFTVTDSANSGRNVRLWDYGKKQVIIDFTEKFHYVSSASFSPDGRSILLSGYPKLDSSDQTSNSISIWDIASGKVFQRLLDDIRIAHCVCYSPDGRFIAAGFERIESNWGESNDTTLKVWDASSGECVMAVTDYTTDVKYLAFSPSGDRIAFAAGGGVININMINSSERTVLRRNNEEVQGPLAFSPNGKLLISGAPNTKAVIWNVERGIMLRVLDSKHRVGHRASVWAVAYSRDGRIVASGDNSDNLILWRASDGKQLRVIKSGTVSNLSFSPDGSLIASCYFRSDLVQIWSTTSGRLVRKLRGHTGGAMGCEFSSDGRYIITAARDADVRLWDVASGKRIRAYIDTISRSYPGFSGFSTIAFGANDSIIVGARGDYIIVWDTQRGTLVCKLTDSLSDRSAMVEVEKTLSTRNRATLFSFSIDWKGHWCRLWDISSGKLIRKFETGIFRSSAALSPDEQFIVTGCYDGITRIWDGSTGKKVFEFSEYSDPSWGVNWSQDGKYIFSGTNEGSLIMWKVPYSIY